MLTIGVDARELLGASTGVGRYLGELLTRWTTRPDAPSRRFVLYTPAPLVLPLSQPLPLGVLTALLGAPFVVAIARKAPLP